MLAALSSCARNAPSLRACGVELISFGQTTSLRMHMCHDVSHPILPSSSWRSCFRMMEVHEAQIRSADPRTRSADPHTRSADPHTRSADPRTRSADPHTRIADPHMRSADPLTRSADPHTRTAHSNACPQAYPSSYFMSRKSNAALSGATAAPPKVSVETDAVHSGFISVVINAVLHRLNTLAPVGGGSGPVQTLEFCVASDSLGVPLQPEPLRDLELWCVLPWGRMHVGRIPVPYDEHFQCTFPPIASASVRHLHPSNAAMSAEASATEGYAICLRLSDEKRLLSVINLNAANTAR